MSDVGLATVPTEVSAEQQELILRTLQSVLNSPHFSKSKRYPAFLEFAVRSALDESAGTLKERTVGVNVFHRQLDYDTGSDPVVRIAASEVRRRIALYFSEHPEAAVRIDLPVGSYKAAFHFDCQPVRQTSPQQFKPQLSVEPMPHPSGLDEVSAQTASESSQGVPYAPQHRGVDVHPWNARQALVLAALLIVLIGAGIWSWHSHGARARRDVWAPLFKSDVPALILVGKTNEALPAGPVNVSAEANGAVEGGRQILVLDDAIVAGQVCSVFRKYGRDCNIGPAHLASVESIRNKSVVSIGGFNNPWTRRLLAPLPYTIQIDNARMIRYVMEHKPTGDVPIESMSADAPSLEPSKDYAIVARFHSDITDSMAVVIAGLGHAGTSTGGQYLFSSKVNEILARAPKDWGGVNFEAVLQIEVVQGNSGHTEVLAARFW